MRVLSRIALVAVVVLTTVPMALADFLVPECPLTLSWTDSQSPDFNTSPHGVFRYGNLVYALRGQTLTTYNVSILGDLQVARRDFIGSLGARDQNGGTAFANGFLYISSEAGLEIYDLRNTIAGGVAPAMVSRTAGLHYRRLAVSGNTLAGIYPSTDIPCYPDGLNCYNNIDIFNVATPSNPVKTGTIDSRATFLLGTNDITFVGKFLYATGVGETMGWDVTAPGGITAVWSVGMPGTFLATDGSSVLAIGNYGSIELYTVSSTGALTPFGIYNLPALTVERSNPIMFHQQATIDTQNGRMITMVDEQNIDTLQPARTIAFDVFDLTVPFNAGSDPKPNEVVSYLAPDEVKFNPTVVGPYIYVVGQSTGVQSYGACGIVAGKIEFNGLTSLNCGGAQIHGWVTGSQKVASVEVFLDAGSLGTATLGGGPRIDIPSPARTQITGWAINVDLDQTTAGVHILRAVGTDSLGNRQQFAAVPVLFNGPGSNCTNRRRAVQ